MIFKPYYDFETGCAACLFGCGGLGKRAVVDAHERDLHESAVSKPESHGPYTRSAHV